MKTTRTRFALAVGVNDVHRVRILWDWRYDHDEDEREFRSGLMANEYMVILEADVPLHQYPDTPVVEGEAR